MGQEREEEQLMQWGSHRSEHLLAAFTSSIYYRHSTKLLSGNSFGSHYLYPRFARWDWAQAVTSRPQRAGVGWERGTRAKGFLPLAGNNFVISVLPDIKHRLWTCRKERIRRVVQL